MKNGNRKFMGVKLLLGALCGWVGVFLLISIILGVFRDSLDSAQPVVFLSLAPGVIVGIVVVYIVNKPSGSHHSTLKRETLENRLIKLKT